MSKSLSVTLGICIAAGGVAVGALFVSPEAPGPAASASHDAVAHPPTYGGQQGEEPDAGTAAPTLTISNFAIQSITVAPGATVSVINADSAAHTVTAEDGSFDTGEIAAGGSSTFTAPTAPGTYAVFCAIHPSMTAIVTVA